MAIAPERVASRYQGASASPCVLWPMLSALTSVGAMAAALSPSMPVALNSASMSDVTSSSG